MLKAFIQVTYLVISVFWVTIAYGSFHAFDSYVFPGLMAISGLAIFPPILNYLTAAFSKWAFQVNPKHLFLVFFTIAMSLFFAMSMIYGEPV